VTLQVSHSQFKPFRSCKRQWWFDNVVRMPAGQPSYELTFGNVLHAVVERWLRAGIDGRDAQGREVDLYPEGWQWVNDRGRWSRIEAQDEGVVQRLVDLAVARGYLERLPGRQIERPFGGLLIQGESVFGPHVLVTGRIDLLLPPTTVTDHKTTKNLRYAASNDPASDRFIGNDEQLLLYAKVLAEEHPEQTEFTVRHLIYDRIKVDVAERKAIVTREKVNEAWEALKPLALEMLGYARADLDESQWHCVPGALDVKEESHYCAMQFGKPCRYLEICAGTETTEKYRRRHLRLALPDSPTNKEGSMASLNDRLAALAAENSAPAAPLPLKETVARMEQEAKAIPPGHLGTIVLDEAADGLGPVECVACSGSGRNSAGGYCVCPRGTRLYSEEKTSLMPHEQRKVEESRVESQGDTPAPEKPAKRRAGRPKKAESEKKPDPTSAPASDPSPTTPTAAATQKANTTQDPSDLLAADFSSVPDQRTKPSDDIELVEGLTILHNCALLKPGQGNTITAADLLRAAVEEVGGNTLEEFYKSDVWKRRDTLKSLGKRLADRLGPVVVLAGGQDGDEQAVIAAISPYSSIEIGARA
jgi:hypothetical protein